MNFLKVFTCKDHNYVDVYFYQNRLGKQCKNCGVWHPQNGPVSTGEDGLSERTGIIVAVVVVVAYIGAQIVLNVLQYVHTLLG